MTSDEQKGCGAAASSGGGGGGGIPRHGRSLIEAVNRWCESNGTALSVLSLNDRDGEVHLDGCGKTVRIRGFGRDKGRFVALAARGLRAHKSGIVLIGLANFLSAAPVLRAAGRGFGIGLMVHGLKPGEAVSRPKLRPSFRGPRDSRQQLHQDAILLVEPFSS